MGWIAVPRASVTPPLACIDSMRPIPANRFQLIPQAGSEAVMICSALRYADSAIVGTPSLPGECMTTVGGGADTAAAAMWKLSGSCWMAMTLGPDESLEAGATTATGAIVACRSIGVGAAAPTAPANTKGVITATANARVRLMQIPRCRTAAMAPRAPELPAMRTRRSMACEPFGHLRNRVSLADFRDYLV